MAELHTRRNTAHEVDFVEVDVTYNDVPEGGRIEFFFDRTAHPGDELADHNLHLSLEEAWDLWRQLSEALGIVDGQRKRG